MDCRFFSQWDQSHASPLLPSTSAPISPGF
jgi:hypothetical protein